MRILHLHFRNINSLAGEFSIDFAHPALSDSGVFTITGPTGAGKTTVLDAIAFALYGQTPRQSTISAGANELMSRESPDCEATVLFERDSQRYRVSTRHRRRKTRAGTIDPQPFAPPERRFESLAADGTAQLQSTKAREVNRLVEEHSGLKYDNFCRCMMLPQGDFARFLRASESERSEVLSTITGTGIYQQIGELVLNKLGELRHKLEQYHLQPVLSDDALRDLHLRKQQADSNLRALREEQSHLDALLSWRAELSQAEQALRASQSRQSTASQNLQNFEQDGRQARLDQATRAAEVAAAEHLHNTLREQLERTTRLMHELEQELSHLQPSLEQAQTARSQAQQQKDDESRPLLLRQQRIETLLRPLEAQHIALKTQCQATRQTTEKAQAETRLCRLREREAATALDSARHTLQQAKSRLSALQADAALPAAISGIELAWSQYHNLQSPALPSPLPDTGSTEARLRHTQQHTEQLLQTSSAEQRSQRLTLLQQLIEQNTALDTSTASQQKLELAVRRAQELMEALPPLDKARQHAQHAQEQLELIHHQASIEDKLELLYLEFRSGKRDHCPCCGSTTCGQRAALADSALSRAQAAHDQAQQELRELSSRHQLAEQTQHEAQAALAARRAEHQAIRGHINTLAEKLQLTDPILAPALLQQEEQELQQLNRATQELQQLQKLLPVLRARDTYIATIRPFTQATADTPETSTTSLNQLRTRAAAYTQAETHLKLAEQTHTQAQQQAAAQHQLLIDKEQHEQRLTQELAELTTRQQQLSTSIRRDWGTDSASQQIQSITTRLHELDTALEHAQAHLNSLLSTRQHRQGQLEQQRRQHQITREELEQATAAYHKTLREQGFDNQSAYLTAKPCLAERETLQQQRHELLQALTAANTAVDVELHHVQELSTRFPSTSPDTPTLLQTRQELTDTLHTAEQLHEHLARELDFDTRQRALNSQTEQQTAPIRAQLARWQKLYDVLGGTRDAFRKYAQGITFHLLIQHANQQLAHLSDRYLLTISPDNPLIPCIIDRYQDDEPRSCSNLSGGESFLISLALALGLSHMTGDTRIDTLFLDEGFGTLDAETLEHVMDCLQALQADGRTVGIITHVEQLKERIPYGIEVISTGKPGYSTLAAHPAITAHPAP